MTTLLFVHGWGFDSTVWDEVIRRLDGMDCAAVDLGFRGERRLPEIQGPLVVGHSMGFAWALAHLPGPWAGAVAVNAFPRFTRADDFPDGVPPHRLQRMQAQFAETPAEVTATFLARCGVAEPDVAGLRPGPLAEGLAWLAECDQRAALATLACPLLALAGDADPLVTPAMSRAGFAGRPLDFLPDGGHLLPVTHPEWLAARIRAFAAELT
jgi:pimeloyl-[acyl-carrier protein] methyl ester esterase